jgi:hypothetical protein
MDVAGVLTSVFKRGSGENRFCYRDKGRNDMLIWVQKSSPIYRLQWGASEQNPYQVHLMMEIGPISGMFRILIMAQIMGSIYNTAQYTLVITD